MLARFPLLVLALGAPALAVPPPSPPPPPISTSSPATPSPPLVLNWRVSDVTCANGARIVPAHFVSPDPQASVARFANGAEPVTITFAIDADGRALDMTAAVEPRFRSLTRDLMPSLRASRFAVDGPQTGCTISYTPEAHDIAEAPLETLARFGVAQRLRIPKEAWDRIASGDCRDTPRAAPLSRSYPDFRKLARPEGERHWAYVTYDLDADGVPANLAVPLTSGYPELEAEARAAVAAGRYAGGPRTGCVQAWWTGPEIIPAPPIPPKDETRGNPACDIKDRWEREPRLVFPANYRQRTIEGWAIVRYDVAPWGEIGGIEVLDAQPSSEFGEAAVNVIRNARLKQPESGLKGCVDRVIFRIRRGEDGSEDPGTADPA